jgi:hypothetical protein
MAGLMLAYAGGVAGEVDVEALLAWRAPVSTQQLQHVLDEAASLVERVPTGGGGTAARQPVRGAVNGTPPGWRSQRGISALQRGASATAAPSGQQAAAEHDDGVLCEALVALRRLATVVKLPESVANSGNSRLRTPLLRSLTFCFL